MENNQNLLLSVLKLIQNNQTQPLPFSPQPTFPQFSLGLLPSFAQETKPVEQKQVEDVTANPVKTGFRPAQKISNHNEISSLLSKISGGTTSPIKKVENTLPIQPEPKNIKTSSYNEHDMIGIQSFINLFRNFNPQPQVEEPVQVSTIKEPSNNNNTLSISSKSKKIKKVNKCGHEDKEHYAKNMCSNCYHKYGRSKKPWKCSHDKLYAHGLCQNCYINDYNRSKKLPKGSNEDNQSEISQSSLEQKVEWSGSN